MIGEDAHERPTAEIRTSSHRERGVLSGLGRRRKVLYGPRIGRLRAQGLSWAQITERLGCSDSPVSTVL